MSKENNASGKSFPCVGAAEAGQKILQFLHRRLDLPPALLHRWLRTGQIRLNGCRCKYFERVKAGDVVRIPPLALDLARQSGAQFKNSETGASIANACPEYPADCAQLPPLVGSHAGIWALNKPAGLPVQSGSGHSDSVAARLRLHFSDLAFKPAPCHRLDRDTSGILLVGSTFEAMRQLQGYFRAGLVHKEYLAWARGAWPWPEPVLLRDFICKSGAPGREKMHPDRPGNARCREALCVVRLLRTGKKASMLQIRLLTGIKHQIRCQLARVGSPVLGDGKYGCPGRFLYLHSLRTILPQGLEFGCVPPWTAGMAQAAMPEPLCLNWSARDILALPYV